MIGGHFPRAVRRSLAQLQADPRNDWKKLNNLFAKYNLPQTAMIDREYGQGWRMQGIVNSIARVAATKELPPFEVTQPFFSQALS